MYEKYFGFEGKPFSITPDPRFLYMSARHREALAHLLYGIGEGGGFVELTGEVGTGKTTLCRCLLEQLPDGIDVALILNPMLNAFELVATICDELKIEYPSDASSIKTLIDLLNEHLLRTHAQGRRTVLIIDEAQNLSAEVLEQVRLLTNLETTQTKLLQIILIGQPELKELLERSDMRQLAQRITARYHLEPLNSDDARAYIQHRLRVSGGRGNLFSGRATDEILKLSGGVPRMINILCDRALLGAYVEENTRVDKGIVRRAAGEVLPEQGGRPPVHWAWRVAAVLLVAAPLGWWGWMNRDSLQPTSDVVALPESNEVIEAVRSAAVAQAITSEDETYVELLAEAAALSTELPADQATSDSFDVSALVSASKPTLPEPDFNALLTDAGDSSGLRAWRALFETWNAPLWLDGELQPCQQATREGLRCLVRNGNWTQMLTFNRPAILELVANDGQRVSVLLREVEDDRAEIVVADESVTVSREEIDKHWYGTYVLLWKPPLGSGSLRVGDRGPNVEWLRHRIDRQIAGGGAVSDPTLFDADLEQRVRQFQAQHSLRQDGVAGSETMIHLNSLEEAGTVPLLEPAAG